MSLKLDNPGQNDNRLYDYTEQDFYVRAEFPFIADWIKAGSRVIDLGAGNGSLLKYLADQKKVSAEGLESSESGVTYAVAHGLNVRPGMIDVASTYAGYADKQFDYAIANVTLQMVMFPEVLLAQMQRIARYQIISFPNFAFWLNRLDVLFNGVMPRPMLFGYTWYSTGHIHQLSLKDFEVFCQKQGLAIRAVEHVGRYRPFARYLSANLFSKTSVFLLESK